MSAAMVTNGANQLQAAVHLIGTDQLPMPENVSVHKAIFGPKQLIGFRIYAGEGMCLLSP